MAFASLCLGGLVLLVIVVVVALIVIYNRLVVLRNRVDNAWAQIDVQLKRRYDLIPNLVETVKGYRDFEASTLEKVTQARNIAMSAQGPQQQAAAENMLSGALKSLFAVAEAYPDLKANASFISLQDELSNTEGKIAYARQFYNDTVLSFNNGIQTFPNNVIAGAFNFTAKPMFDAEPEAEQAVKVQF